MTPLLMTILFSILPISELRGAIPYAVYNGFSIPLAAVIAIAANACVPVIAFLFLESLHKLFYKIRPYRDFLIGLWRGRGRRFMQRWRSMAIGDSCSLSRCRYRLQGHGQGRLELGCLVCHTKGFFCHSGRGGACRHHRKPACCPLGCRYSDNFL